MSVTNMADVFLDGKRVLIREDLNVPIANGKVSSDARIRAALPTIRAALDANAAVMLMSHLGRPTEGQPEEDFSLQVVADHLGTLLEREVPLVKDWIDGVELEPGNVVLLENVRFLVGEKACDTEPVHRRIRRSSSALCRHLTQTARSGGLLTGEAASLVRLFAEPASTTCSAGMTPARSPAGSSTARDPSSESSLRSAPVR